MTTLLRSIPMVLISVCQIWGFTTTAIAAEPYKRTTTVYSVPDSYGRVSNIITRSYTFPNDAANVNRYEYVKQSISRTFASPNIASNWTQLDAVICQSTTFTQETTGEENQSLTQRMAWRYDTKGRLWKEIKEPSATDCVTENNNTLTGRLVTETLYHPTGNVLSTAILSGLNIVPQALVNYTYDTTGTYATTTTNVLGHINSQSINLATGTVNSTTDINSLTSTWEYDSFGREVIETTPEGVQTKTTYNWCEGDITCPANALYQIKVEVTHNGVTLAPTTISYYDSLERLLKSKEQRSASTWVVTTEKVYNSLGQLDKEAQPYVEGETIYWTSYSYDNLGRLQTVNSPKGIRKLAYDSLKTVETNEKGQKKTLLLGIHQQPRIILDHENNTLTSHYTPLGKIAKTTDALGNTRSYVYDNLGNKLKDKDPDLGEWTYTYDGLDQVKTQTDSKGQITQMTYDKLGRLTRRLEADLDSTWVYDTASSGKGKGKIASEASSNGYSRSYSYDSLGRNSSINTTLDNNTYTTTNTYDSAGRPNSFIYPTGIGYQNIYDAYGLLGEVRDANSSALYWKAIKRNAQGQVTEEQLGNGLTTKRAYKSTTGYIDTIQTGTVSGTTLTANVQNDSYTFDSLGNLTFRNEALNNVAEAYGYDNLNRLTSATRGNEVKTVQYDALGRIIVKSEVGTYTYHNGTTGICGGLHRVCNIKGRLNTSFDYDVNGNMLSGNGRTYTWTSFNMPVSITQGSNSEGFIYNANHERVKRTSIENGQTATTYYLNPRLDLGGTFEKNIKPDNSVEYVHHVYAGGEAIGSVVTTDTYSAPVTQWSTDLSVAPTTANPNSTGLTFPTNNPDGLVAWDNGRLAFTSKAIASTTTTNNVYVGGQRSYVADNILFKGEVTTTVNTGSEGRYLWLQVQNNGSTSAKTTRYHAIFIRGNSVYAYFVDGRTDANGNLSIVTQKIGSVLDNTTYMAEIETTPTSSILYFYPKGQTRANGYSHSTEIDWRSGNGTGNLSRRLQLYVFGKQTTDAVNTTYVDNLSESKFVAQGTRYFHTDHLDSINAVTNASGKVLERFSYDAWGKRRLTNGADDMIVNSLWSTDLSVAPTTTNPNSTGLTFPTNNPDGLVAWDNGRLAFTSKAIASTTTTNNVYVGGQRSYVADNILFKGEVTTTVNTGSEGRYLWLQVQNNGSTSAKTTRYHAIFIRGNSVYAYFVDGRTDANGNLSIVTQKIGSVLDNTTYMAEIETTPTSSILYFYPKGQTRANGYRHSAEIDWRSGNGTGNLSRRLQLYVFGKQTTDAVNTTYVDNLSESSFVYPSSTIEATSTKHGFTGHESLDTIGLVHMNGRVYDPVVGRFVSADPNVFYPDDLQDYNVYSYVHNNPLSAIDPSGYMWWAIEMFEEMEEMMDYQQSQTFSSGGSWSPTVSLQTMITQSSSTYYLGNSAGYNAYPNYNRSGGGSTSSSSSYSAPASRGFVDRSSVGGMFSMLPSYALPDNSSYIKALQTALDAGSLTEIPVVSQVSGVASAILSAVQGDLKGAALSAAGIVPGLGALADATKLGRSAEKLNDAKNLDLAKSGEDLFVGTYGQVRYGNLKSGLNPTHTPHHVVQNAVSPVNHSSGIAINMRKDLHELTRTYKKPVEANLNIRQHLAKDIRDLRNIFKDAGYERSQVNRQLQELIRQNKSLWEK